MTIGGAPAGRGRPGARATTTGSVRPMRLVDARGGRFEQALVVVVLLAAFAFRQPWGIPVALVVAAMGAVLGERSPVARWWTRLAARRKAPPMLEPVTTQLRQRALMTAGLALATLLLLLGAVTLASLLAGLVAVVAALGAVGLLDAAAEIARRRGRR